MSKQGRSWFCVLGLFLLLELPAQAYDKDVREYTFWDGARVRVHFNRLSSPVFASDVLDAAVSAYQTLTQFQGFGTAGYTFAKPDIRYAYDPDRTIDIYLGSSEEGGGFEELGTKNKLFRDAPCFDTRRTGEARYEAMIFLPANYEAFIRGWEKMNPSPLGRRNIEVDLRGTLIHEMTHAIVFYYNKNLGKAGEEAHPGAHLDWYVEGLARYFETFAGAKHDFYSQGFKETLPDKIRFSRGGSNYFMRYPDQAFTGLRYENALFWRFMDTRFGMPAIESLSRKLRGRADDFKRALEEVTGMDFKTLLEQYAAAVLLGDFGLKEDGAYLQEVAKTRLFVEKGEFFLVDGQEETRWLGGSCQTDWIGRWGEARASFGQPPVAGDTTDVSDVSAWATDFLELRFADENSPLRDLTVANNGTGLPLSVQLFVYTRGGSILRKQPLEVARGDRRRLGLSDLLLNYSLQAWDLEKVVLAVTNTDPENTAPYEILS